VSLCIAADADVSQDDSALIAVQVAASASVLIL